MLSQIALLAGLWCLWRIVRAISKKSPYARLPGPPSSSFMFGNIVEAFKEQSWDFHREIEQKYGGVTRLKGPFGGDWLYVYDPSALHGIFIKNHESFIMNNWLVEANRIAMGPGLFAVAGDVHRRQRKMLTPVFSIKHMKQMMPIFEHVTGNLVKAISSRLEDEPKEIEIFTWMSRTALALIGEAGIGYSLDTLIADTPDEYGEAVKYFLPVLTTGLMTALRWIAGTFGPLVPYRLQRPIVDLIPSSNLKEVARLTDRLHEKSCEIYAAKKAMALKGEDIHDGLLKDVGQGKDIMSILVRANLEAAEEDRLPDEEITGSLTVILFAAMDTTANAMARTLEILARHPDAQKRLRRELQDAFDANNGNPLDYEELHRLPFLDAVCRETLRLYAPVTLTFREAASDAVLPLFTPIRGTDGNMITEVPVVKGTNVIVAVHNANRNKEVWGEDAYEWKPERWLQPMRREVEEANIPGVYSNLMTFLGGNRGCIGFKFSQLEMKSVLAALVTNFEYELTDKPIVWNVSGVTYPTTAVGNKKAEMWLKMKKVGAAG